MPVQIKRTSRGFLDVQVAEAFLLEDANAIRDALERAGPGIYALVNLGESRRSEPIALARLADAVHSHRWQIQVRGICWYDARLLTHLGMSEREMGAIFAQADELG